MPLEAAEYVNQLVDTDPNHTDGIAQGDAHLRLIKSTLVASFPNIGAPVTATPDQLNRAGTAAATAGTFEVANNGTVSGASLVLDPVTGSGQVAISNTGTASAPGALSIAINDATNANPQVAATLDRAGNLSAVASLNAPSLKQAGNPLIPSGCILMWSGTVASIPAGWVLCNGSNGTPDLRGMFIAGAGGVLVPGQTGGSATSTASTAAAGSHDHGGAAALAGGHTHGAATDSQGAHTHTGNTQDYTLQLADIPSHSHEQQQGQGSGGTFTAPNVNAGNSLIDAGFQTQATGGSGGHHHGIVSDGTHAHNVSVNAVGDHQHSIAADGTHTHSVTVTVLPPYFALAFIMKT